MYWVSLVSLCMDVQLGCLLSVVAALPNEGVFPQDWDGFRMSSSISLCRLNHNGHVLFDIRMAEE